MKDVVFRNMERLLLLDGEQERERIEPMTEWKWQRPKDENRLSRYLLQIERSRGFIHHLSKQSLKAYASELVSNIKNIEE